MNNQITVSGVFSGAWASFSENISYVYYLLAPMLALSLVGTLLYPEALYFDSSRAVDVAKTLPSFLLAILGIIVGIFSTISLLFFFRSGKKDTYASWTNYFRLLPKYIVVCILQGLMILAGLILFIVPGIYLAVRYAFVSYRTLEHPTESIKNLFAAEAKATEGNRLTLFLVLLGIFAMALVVGSLLGMILSGVLGSEGNAFADFIFELLMTPFFTVVSIIAYLKLTEAQGTESVIQEAEPVVTETILEEDKEVVVIPEPVVEEPVGEEPQEEEKKEESKPLPNPAAEPVA